MVPGHQSHGQLIEQVRNRKQAGSDEKGMTLPAPLLDNEKRARQSQDHNLPSESATCGHFRYRRSSFRGAGLPRFGQADHEARASDFGQAVTP